MKIFSRIFHRPSQTIQMELDSGGHKLPYVFRPASKAGKPLLIVLHGNGNNKIPSKFCSPEYNVLLPLDQYGIKNNGCWFLGENGDFFVFNMLKSLIHKLRARAEIGPMLYFWGSSMGGYAALLFALVMEGHAAFCHIPQINLQDSSWYRKNHVFIDFIFGNDFKKHPWRNLSEMVLKHEGRMPLLFLSFNRFDRPGYIEDHLLPLQKVLEQKKLNYFLQIHPQYGHANHQSVAQHVANFKLYENEIKNNAENIIPS